MTTALLKREKFLLCILKTVMCSYYNNALMILVHRDLQNKWNLCSIYARPVGGGVTLQINLRTNPYSCDLYKGTSVPRVFISKPQREISTSLCKCLPFSAVKYVYLRFLFLFYYWKWNIFWFWTVVQSWQQFKDIVVVSGTLKLAFSLFSEIS